jgi:hypothetical protein
MLVKLFDSSWLPSLSGWDGKRIELVCEHAGILYRGCRFKNGICSRCLVLGRIPSQLGER